MRYRINTPEKKVAIYKTSEADRLHQIAVSGDWVYFLEGMGDHGDENLQLKKIKQDGSKIDILMDNIDSYILTAKKLYYQKTNRFGKVSIYAADMDGNNKHRVTKINNTPYTISYLRGSENGWIYYAEYVSDREDENDYKLYRIREDGTEKRVVIDEKLYDQGDGSCPTFVPENTACYFFRFEQKADITKVHLIKRTDDGKETILTSGSGEEKYTLNKIGKWLYFSQGNRVYKIDADGAGRKQLVYQVDQSGDEDSLLDGVGILLYGDDLIIATTDKAVYVQQD